MTDKEIYDNIKINLEDAEICKKLEKRGSCVGIHCEECPFRKSVQGEHCTDGRFASMGSCSSGGDPILKRSASIWLEKYNDLTEENPEYAKWFTERKFMEKIRYQKSHIDVTQETVSTFLFKMSINSDICKSINFVFTHFLDIHLERATNNDELPVEIILSLLEIESITAYMKTEFIRLVRKDQSILEDNVVDTLIKLICKGE